MKRFILCLLLLSTLILTSACAPAKVWNTDKMGGVDAPTGTLTSVKRVSGGLKYLYSDVQYNDAAQFISDLLKSEFNLNIDTEAASNQLSYYGENVDGESFEVIYNINEKTCAIIHLPGDGTKT